MSKVKKSESSAFISSLKNKPNFICIAYCVMRIAKTNLQNEANTDLRSRVPNQDRVRVHSYSFVVNLKNKANLCLRVFVAQNRVNLHNLCLKILRNAQNFTKIHKNLRKTTLIQSIPLSGPCFVVSRSYIVYRPWIEVFSYGLFAKQTQCRPSAGSAKF